MKGVGMLFVSLRSINFGFWSHLGCCGQNVIIFSPERLVQGCTQKNIKKYIYIDCLCFNMVSFRGQKSLGHAQIGLLQGFNSKFPTSIPTPFIGGAPPPRYCSRQKNSGSYCKNHNVRCRLPGNFSGVRFHVQFHVTFDDLCCKQTFKVRPLFYATLLSTTVLVRTTTRYGKFAQTYKCYFPFAV